MDYRKHIEKIKGDTLIIGVDHPLVPLTGMLDIVDWRLNCLLSHLIIDGIYSGSPSSTLLLSSNGKLSVERIVLLGLGRSTTLDITRILKGIKSRNCSLVLPKDFKINPKTFFHQLRSKNIDWNKVAQHTLDQENLIIFNEIKYN